jgi:predicted RNA binding protein YcfA (HicA-like mRNA interferase family)
MPRFGSTTRTELIRCLRQRGFSGPYSGGKHQFMLKEHLRVRIPNPHRSNIGKNLLRAILREANISTAEWEDI